MPGCWHSPAVTRQDGCVNVVCPPGGVGVQPPVDAGSRQTAAGGEGERGGPEPPETGAEAPSNSPLQIAF